MAQQEEALSGVIGTLLQNPGMMQGVLSLAGSLLSEESENQDAQHRRALLLAVKPYLGQTRQAHLDTLLQILQIVDHLNPQGLATLFAKGGEARETENAIPSA